MNQDMVFEGVTTELFKANAIIAHALALMSEEQKQDLKHRCFIDHVINDDGYDLNFNRRNFLINEARLSFQICKKCGCTDSHGCTEGCWWSKPDLCSECDNRDETLK